MDEQVALLISSCDKFSDLWDEHIRLYRENWKGKQIKTYLVTDKDTDKKYKDVEIIVAPQDFDFPMRIKYALQYISTQYVLLTLDDYFLTTSVKADKISYLTRRAIEEQIDYLLLYDRRKVNPKKFSDVSTLEKIDLDKKYAVTLYPAIWNKNFLSVTVKDDLNPWLYEVSLTKTAREAGAKCYFSPAGTFLILDVVRKGKVLHKADKYFKKNNISIGDRPIISRTIEIKLAIMDFISWYTPRKIFKLIKKVTRKLGMKYYSED